MSENLPEGPDESQPPVVDDPLPTPAPDKSEQKGHMVYDLTEQRFVGRMAETARVAGDSVTRVKGHKYETRKV